MPDTLRRKGPFGFTPEGWQRGMVQLQEDILSLGSGSRSRDGERREKGGRTEKGGGNSVRRGERGRRGERPNGNGMHSFPSHACSDPPPTSAQILTVCQL